MSRRTASGSSRREQVEPPRRRSQSPETRQRHVSSTEYRETAEPESSLSPSPENIRPTNMTRPPQPPHQPMSEWYANSPSDPTSSGGSSGQNSGQSPSPRRGTTLPHRRLFSENAQAGPSSRTRSRAAATFVTELTPPASPAGSSFSFESGMETSKFREDEGRLFSATQDDYPLPVDSPEAHRLDIQHKAFRLFLGANYVGPVPDHLKNGSKGKKVLDIGCGTGKWCVEMGLEFPDVQFTGIDLVPIQPEVIPNNVNFIIEDILNGLPFSDETFDLVHVRFMIAGIRDFPALLKSCARVLKIDGLLLSIEVDTSYSLLDEDLKGPVPFVQQYTEMARTGLLARGLDPFVALRIPGYLETTNLFGQVTTLKAELPSGPWPEDPNIKAIGQLMIQNARAYQETARIMVLDGTGISREDYEHVKIGYLKELDDDLRKVLFPFWMSWAVKLKSEPSEAGEGGEKEKE